MARSPYSDEVRNELEHIKRLLSALNHAVNRIEAQLESSEPKRSEPASAETPRSAPPFLIPRITTTPTAEPQTPAQPTPEQTSSATEQVSPPDTRSWAPARPFAFEEESTVRQLERTLGGQVALWVGLASLFLASVFFLSWAWTQMGPWARLMVGYAGGFALIGLGWLSRRRSAGWFVDGAHSAGLGILYLTTWAGLQRYGVMRFELSFALMVATTVLGMGLASVRNSQVLATVSVAGGFLTPILLTDEGGAGSPLGFFTYLAVLNAGLLFISIRKGWEFQRWFCMIATLVLLNGWQMQVRQLDDTLTGMMFGFLVLYYALFLMTVLWKAFVQRVPAADYDIAFLALITLFYIPLAQSVVMPLLKGYPSAFLAGMGVFHLLLTWLASQRVAQDQLLKSSFLAVGIVLLTIAIPVQFKAPVVAALFNLEAMLLVALGIWFSNRLLYLMGLGLWVPASLVSLIVLASEPSLKLVLFNERGMALLSWTVGMAVSAIVARMRALQQPESAIDRFLPREAVAVLGGLGALFGVVGLSTMETYYYFEIVGQPNNPLASMLVSLEWTLIGALLLVGGVWYHSRGVRLLGLATLAITACKLFLHDLSFLQMPYRIFSFAGLGVTLLIVSWLYSRYGMEVPKQSAEG